MSTLFQYIYNLSYSKCIHTELNSEYIYLNIFNLLSCRIAGAVMTFQCAATLLQIATKSRDFRNFGPCYNVWCWCRLQAFSNVGDGVSTWLAKSMQLIASQHVLRRHINIHRYIYLHSYEAHLEKFGYLSTRNIWPSTSSAHLRPFFQHIFHHRHGDHHGAAGTTKGLGGYGRLQSGASS